MTVAAVAIGRNEGERLERCLTSLQGQVDRIVYVDSGSTDGSVAFARSLGVTVVELDRETPFTAARARNAGAAALAPPPGFIQFVDGDCTVDPGWIAAGRAALEADPGLGLVTGWRREIHPEASLYNRMADVDWHRPAGEIETCGGDMLVRREAFEAVGGFAPDIICAEDFDFCLRLGRAGWRLRRLPLAMTAHDLAMTRVTEWWRRTVRTGHGYAELGHRHPPRFAADRLRAWVYGLALPLALLAGLIVAPWLAGLVVLIYLASWGKTTLGLRHLGRDAPAQALLLTLGKVPTAIGMLTYHWRRWRGRRMELIEYK